VEDYDVFRGGSSTFNARIESAESSGLWRRLLDGKRGVVLLDGFYEWKTSGNSKTPMFIRNRDEYDGHVIDGKSIDHCSSDPGSGATAMSNEPQLAQKGIVLPEKPPAPQAASGETTHEELSGPSHAPLLLAALYDVWHSQEKGAMDGADRLLESVTILTMEPDGTPLSKVHDRMPVFLTPQTAALWLDCSQPFSNVVGTVLRTSQGHAQKQLTIFEVASLVSNVKNESPDCILPKKEFDAKQFAGGLGRFFNKAPLGKSLPEAKRPRTESAKAPADADAKK